MKCKVQTGSLPPGPLAQWRLLTVCTELTPYISKHLSSTPQRHGAGRAGGDLVVLHLQVRGLPRLLLLRAAEEELAPVHPPPAAPRGAAPGRLVRAQGDTWHHSTSRYTNSSNHVMFAWQYVGGGHTTFCGLLNTAVHVVMYSYYFLAGH